MLFRHCNMLCIFTLALSVVCVQCSIRLFFFHFLNFLLSRYVAQVLSEWLWNCSSRPFYYWYHFCFHISHMRNFYYEVFIFLNLLSYIIIIIIIKSLLAKKTVVNYFTVLFDKSHTHTHTHAHTRTHTHKQHTHTHHTHTTHQIHSTPTTHATHTHTHTHTHHTHTTHHTHATHTHTHTTRHTHTHTRGTRNSSVITCLQVLSRYPSFITNHRHSLSLRQLKLIAENL